MSTYIFSDSHLDNSPESLQREQQLVAWLKSIEPTAQRIVMLGDMFDFWFTYRKVVPRGHTRLIGQLATMADKGTEIHYFIGNHDMWVFDYFQQEIGAIVHSSPEELTIDGKSILFGHGDGLGVTHGSYPVLKRIFRCRLNQKLFALLPSAFSFPIAHSWSRQSRKSHGTKYLSYLGDDNEELLQYCLRLSETTHYDYMVFGHRHLAMTHQLHNNCLYVNVGDWFANRDYAVIANGELTLKVCDYKNSEAAI